MACCGQARSNVTQGTAIPGSSAAGGSAVAENPVFVYVGETAMTVVGSGTGRIYRFEHPGARQQVDPRDARSFAAVPKVKRAG